MGIKKTATPVATKSKSTKAKTAPASKQTGVASEAARKSATVVTIETGLGGADSYVGYLKAQAKKAGVKGKVLTSSEVAEVIGRHENTLKGWRRRPSAPQPSVLLKVGTKVAFLYTADDVKALKAYSKAVGKWGRG